MLLESVTVCVGGVWVTYSKDLLIDNILLHDELVKSTEEKQISFQYLHLELLNNIEKIREYDFK